MFIWVYFLKVIASVLILTLSVACPIILTLSVACPIILTLSVASKLYLDNGSQEPPLRCLVLGIFDAGLRVSCARDFMSGGILPLLRL